MPISSAHGLLKKRHVAFVESSPALRTRMQQEQRRLHDKLDVLERRRAQVLHEHDVERVRMRWELGLGLGHKSIPLDNLRIPNVRFSQLGYASGITARGRHEAAPSIVQPQPWLAPDITKTVVTMDTAQLGLRIYDLVRRASSAPMAMQRKVSFPA